MDTPGWDHPARFHPNGEPCGLPNRSSPPHLCRGRSVGRGQNGVAGCRCPARRPAIDPYPKGGAHRQVGAHHLAGLLPNGYRRVLADGERAEVKVCLFNMITKYNAKLTPIAQTLRNHMTPEEKHLWYDFLKRLPVTVNRQKIIGDYIVDFFQKVNKTFEKQ